MHHVEKVTSYFSYHTKGNKLLQKRHANNGISEDRFEHLKQDISPQLQSRLFSVLTYLTRVNSIHHVASELNTSSKQLLFHSPKEMNTLAKFICIFCGFVTRGTQLEAHCKVTLSRAPTFLCKLSKILQINPG